MLFILNRQQHIVGVLDNEAPQGLTYWNDMTHESLESGMLLYQFDTLGDHPDTELLTTEGSILRRKEGTEEFHLFQIKEIYARNEEGQVISQVECENIATTELLGHIARPQSFLGENVDRMVDSILRGSDWSVGVVENSRLIRDFEISKHLTALDAIRQIIDLFEMEVEFGVALDQGRIKTKHIHIKEKRGDQMARTRFVYGENMLGASRNEETRDTVTGLVGVGRADEDGNFMSILDTPHQIEDPDIKVIGDALVSESAFQQFNMNGRHILGIYEDNEATNPVALWHNTYRELKRLIEPRYTYQVDIVLLQQLAGYQHRTVQIGDLVIVSDTTFKPTLLLEARIIELQISEKHPEDSQAVLGDYVPLLATTHSTVDRIQQIIREKERQWDSAHDRSQEALDIAGQAHDRITDVEDDVGHIQDEVDDQRHTIADMIDDLGNISGIVTDNQNSNNTSISNILNDLRDVQRDVEHAQENAQNAIDRGDEIYDELRQAEDRIQVAIDNQDQIINGISESADRINLLVAGVNENELDGIIARHETQIEVNKHDIGLRVTQDQLELETGALRSELAQIEIGLGEIALEVVQRELDPIEERVSENRSQIQMLTDQIQLKVDSTTVDKIEERVTNNEASIAIHEDQIALRARQTDVDQLTGRIENAESQLSVMPDQIVSTVRETITDPLSNTVQSQGTSITQTANRINSIASGITNENGILQRHQTQIDQSTEQIALRVTREQAQNISRDQADDAIDELNLGARNILLETVVWRTVIPDGNANHSLQLYRIVESQQSQLARAQVTLTFDWEATGSNFTGIFQIQMLGNTETPWSNLSDAIQLSSENTKGTASRTVTLGAHIWTGIQVRHDHIPNTVTMNYRNMRLQFGRKDLGWSLAPEDTQADISELFTRMQSAEIAIEADNITSSIMESQRFEDFIRDYPTHGDLDGAVSPIEGALDVLKRDFDDSMAGEEGRVNQFTNERFSQVEQRVDNVTTTFETAGGINMLRNSIGFAGFDNWMRAGTNSDTLITSIQTGLSDIGQTHGFRFAINNGGNELRQDISLTIGQRYTLSWRFRRIVPGTAGNFTLGIANRSNILQSGASQSYPFNHTTNHAAQGWEFGSLTFTAALSDARVQLLANPNTGAVEVTSLMLHLGSTPLAWQNHPQEIHSASVRLDMNGIRVENNQHPGHTSITPQEFAGYYGEGAARIKVFSMDKDEFVMNSADINQGIKMGSVQIVRIENNNHSGWGFVGNTS